MPETTELYWGANHLPMGAGTGALITSQGGPSFVVCNDATTATTNPTHVYDALDGTSTGHDTLIRWAMDLGSFIEFNHVVICSDAATITVNTAPVISVFGETPVFEGKGGKPRNQRRLPQDINQDGLDITSFGLWTPLTTPDYTAGSPTLTLDNAAIEGDIGTDGRIYISEPKYVFRAGCTKGIITVNTAASVSVGSAGGGNVTHNMILARIHG